MTQLTLSMLDVPYAKPLVMLAMGQSMIAAANVSFASGGDLTVNDRVFIFNSNTRVFQVWDPGTQLTYTDNDGVNTAPVGHNSIAFQMAKEAQRTTGRDVYIILDAHPGDAIANWITTGGAKTLNYVSMSTLATEALSATVLDGQKVEMVLYGQGESDGNGDYSYAARGQFADSLKILLEFLAAESFTDPSVAVAILQLIYSATGTEISFSLRNDVIENLHYYDIGITHEMVRTEDLVEFQSGSHWSGAAADIIGKRAYHVAANCSPTKAKARRDMSGRMAFVDKRGNSGFEVGSTAGGSPYFAPIMNGGEPDFTNYMYFQTGVELWRMPKFSAEEMYVSGYKRFNTLGTYNVLPRNSSQFLDIGNSLNTTDKEQGTSAYSIQDQAEMFAQGPLPADEWKGVSLTTGNVVTYTPS